MESEDAFCAKSKDFSSKNFPRAKLGKKLGKLEFPRNFLGIRAL